MEGVVADRMLQTFKPTDC